MLTKSIILLASITAATLPMSGQIAHTKKILLPSYPELPRVVRIQGIVQVELSVENGRVTSYKATSGPTHLANGNALKRILDWEFEKTCPKLIKLNIEFILQPYDGNKFFGGTEGSIIELTYPNTIKITSKQNPSVE